MSETYQTSPVGVMASGISHFKNLQDDHVSSSSNSHQGDRHSPVSLVPINLHVKLDQAQGVLLR